MTRPIRFPKVHSPFERTENDAGEYVVIPEVADGYEWVFESDHVLAVEKLDGTNCAVAVESTDEGLDITGYTRHGPEPMQHADPYGTPAHQHIVRGIQNALQRGYLDDLDDGVHYGECVGPMFQGNSHELDENLFIPFEWMRDKCAYTSWGKYPKTFESINEWFRDNLFSLFYSRMHGCSLDSASVANGTFCEGIVFIKDFASYDDSIEMEEEHTSKGFYRKFAPNMAKLRRDMFEWYEGARH